MDLSSLQTQLQTQSAKQAQSPSLQGAPVHLWNPPFCGDIDINITNDGTWLYTGTPITRLGLVQLFSSVLKKEQHEYYLVTPVEKVRIQVADVPFVITEWQQQDGCLYFTTKEGIQLQVGEDHPVELRQQSVVNDTVPYVQIRNNLFARFHQNVFYQLVELGETVTAQDGTSHLMLKSGNYQFSLGNF